MADELRALATQCRCTSQPVPDQTWTSSTRVQILRSDGTVYNGWARATQVP